MPYQCISVSDAQALVSTSGTQVLDIRDADAYAQLHVEGAIHVTNENAAMIAATTAKDKPLLVYCYHGNSSKGAAEYFSGLGFSDVYSVDGGFEAWRLVL